VVEAVVEIMEMDQAVQVEVEMHLLLVQEQLTLVVAVEQELHQVHQLVMQVVVE
jgi:hypothetical protein